MSQATKLNHFWQRVIFEGMTLKVACQEQLDSISTELIRLFMDYSLQMQQARSVARDDSENDEDEDENFDKDQRTSRNDDLDFFAKLMRTKIDFSQ